MNIRIEPVTPENFKDLPDFPLFPYSCKYCAFWESLDFNDNTKKSEGEQMKRKWFDQVLKDFGNCGFIVYVDSAPVGFAQYAPPRYFPTISKCQVEKPSKDSAFLACLYIARRELWGKRIGTLLLKKTVCDLKKRGYTAIETLAQANIETSGNSAEDSYLGPAEFFTKQGFTVKSQRGRIVLLRKELTKDTSKD